MTDRQARYDRIAIALHWLIGVALLAQIAFGFLLDDLAPRGTPERAAVINLHKSTGIVLALLIGVRLAWRLARQPPPWPPAMQGWQQRVAAWTHRALYACMVILPLSGYVGSNFSKHGVKFFGVALRPWGPDWHAGYAFFNGLHVTTAFVLTILIIMHVAAALWHVLVKRDGMFSRMWPLSPGPGGAAGQNTP